jgi:riboflavin synthase
MTRQQSLQVGLLMFSGIIETEVEVLKFQDEGSIFRLWIRRPDSFDDLHVGDSICVDGVCLTVESFTESELLFAVGPETLKITDWPARLKPGCPVNVERSLRWGDRVHGHLVTGHVDAVGEISSVERRGDSLLLQVMVPPPVRNLVWKKGSLAVNGVSLTVNSVESDQASFCLIPETLRRTNLGELKKGQVVNLEADWMARFLARQRQLENLNE